MKTSLSAMFKAQEAAEKSRLDDQLICPLSRRPLRILQGRRSHRWFVSPCELGCKGCDRPIYWFEGWASKEELLTYFRHQLSLVEETV